MGLGLFFDPAHLERIRENYLNHPEFAELRQAHGEFDYATKAAWMDGIRYNDQVMVLRPLRVLAEELAFMAPMTQDSKAEEMAKRAVWEIMKSERWDFYMDDGESIAVQRASHSTVAVALVIDLLGDRIELAGGMKKGMNQCIQ